jgi:hypothetical protein
MKWNQLTTEVSTLFMMVLTNQFENLLVLGIPYFKRTLYHKRPTARVPIDDHLLSNMPGLKSIGEYARAYTNQPNQLVVIKSQLIENILRAFRQANIELLSPTFVALREDAIHGER